jgi:hypothetical protein
MKEGPEKDSGSHANHLRKTGQISLNPQYVKGQQRQMVFAFSVLVIRSTLKLEVF